MAATDQHFALDAQNPWPGLAAYDEAASDFFNGRDADAEELLRLVRLAPLTVLYGKSGLGKSSLLLAGLFPRLRQAHYLPIYIRLDIAQTAEHAPLNQAAQRLREELAAHGADFPAFEPGETLWRYLHRRDLELWSQDNNLLTPVLVFDQFEELFTHGGFDVERGRRVCHALADVIENRIPTEITSSEDGRRAAARLDVFSQRYRVILSFREDFLPDLKNWEHDVPSLLKNWRQLQPMNREQAVAATQSGAAVLAPGAADAIVDFVGNLEQTRTEGDSSIEPVLLSLCCYQLNLRRQQRQAAVVDAALVGAEGQDILQRFYTEALASMPKTVSQFIEDHLIQGNRYRGSYPEDDAIEKGFVTPEQLAELTSRHRLLRIDRQRGTARIELIHDRLVGVVSRACDLRLATERQRAQEAQRQSELERQRALEQTRTVQRLRWLSGGLTLASLLAIAAMIFAWQQQQVAESSLKARSEVLLATSKVLDEAAKVTQESQGQRELAKNILAQAQSTFASASRGDEGAPTNVPSSLGRIYIQIRPDQPREKVQQIRQKLKEQHFDVPSIEKLAVGPTTNTEVRYFQNTEEDRAKEIVGILQGSGVKNMKPIYIPGYENSTKIRPKHFEIWFAPNAFKAE